MSTRSSKKPRHPATATPPTSPHQLAQQSSFEKRTSRRIAVRSVPPSSPPLPPASCSRMYCSALHRYSSHHRRKLTSRYHTLGGLNVRCLFSPSPCPAPSALTLASPAEHRQHRLTKLDAENTLSILARLPLFPSPAHCTLFHFIRSLAIHLRDKHAPCHSSMPLRQRM